MTDCIDMNQYGCTQWINMPSNIPSTTQQTGGNVSAASRPIRSTAPRRSTTSSTPGQQSADLTAFLNSLPPDDPRIPLLLDALDKLNKQHPKEVPPVPAKDLQCLFTPQQSGSDAPLPPLRLCPGRDWDLSNMWKEGIQAAGLCAGITDDDEFADCSDQNYGIAVLTDVPQMSSYCYEGPDYGIGDMAECAKRKFKKAWYDKIFNHIPPDPDQCAIVPPPDPPTWTTAGAAACKAKRQPLRKNLRCQLDPKCSGQPNDDGDDNTPAASQDPPPDAPPEPPPLPKELEAWCNFMADAHRRGDYGGIPIPAECPREQAAYTKPPPANPLFALNPIQTEQAINDLIKQWQDHWKDDAPDQSTQTNDNVPK
jgi:hypothetical protein